jgi:hypothetical protein
VSELALVVNVHTKSLASGTPPELLAPVEIVPVNVVLTASRDVGVKIAILFVAS